MIFLFDSMSLVMPEIGYFFWTALAFIIFWILIGKYAVRPIQNSIEARNKSIEDSLAQAEIARKEIASMQAKNEDLLKRQVASTSNLLQGIAPGVSVQQQSGKPGGDGANIRIRGIGSINAGTFPLILVDNVEMSIDAIDPNAIDNITILKDAASTAIFGARAANGVVIIPSL